MSKMPKDKDIVITVNSYTVVRVLVLVAVTLLLISFIKNIAHPLTLIAISFFLAIALNPAVSKIASKLKSKSRVRATGVAYILVLSFLAAFLSFVVPPLISQTADFVKDVPGSIQDYKKNNASIDDFIHRNNLQDDVNKFTTDFSKRFDNIGEPILSTASAIGSTIVSVIVVLVLTFMMLIEGPAWLKRFWDAQPSAKRAYRKSVATKMYKVVTNYVNAQVFIAALGGFFASIMLYIMSQVFNAPVNAIALGGIIALFALIPMIGTIAGSVIVILACLLVSVPLAIFAAIYFVVYQQIENATIQPYVQSRGNTLTPLIVLIAALIGVNFGGILGAFAAIPTAGCLKILIEEYYSSRKQKSLAK